MSNELQYYGHTEQTGLSVIARVHDSSGAQVGTDIQALEIGTLSIYSANMPASPLGQYGIRFFSGTNLLGQGFINWDGVKEIDFNLDVQVSTRNSLAPDNASITAILADTNELQLNQDNFSTATGFATPANVTDAQAAIIAEVDANETKIDDVKAKTDLIPALL